MDNPHLIKSLLDIRNRDRLKSVGREKFRVHNIKQIGEYLLKQTNNEVYKGIQ